MRFAISLLLFTDLVRLLLQLLGSEFADFLGHFRVFVNRFRSRLITIHIPNLIRLLLFDHGGFLDLLANLLGLGLKILRRGLELNLAGLPALGIAGGNEKQKSGKDGDICGDLHIV